MKKFIIIALILFLAFTAGIIYLNKVIFPVKIKALIISALEKQTGANVSLKSAEFSVFKGLVLSDLVISDSQNVILSARQANCSIFIWPIFKKQIIIPGINLKSPYIFLERRQDGSFNLEDLFKPAPPSAKKSDFSISVFKISVSSGDVVFQDDTLSAGFKKEVKNIQFNLQLGLPVSLKFNFKGEIANNPSVFINASGEYKILDRSLAANITIKNLSPKEFQAYYSNLGDLVSGSVDLQAQINFKDPLLQANITAKGNDLVLAKDKLEARFNSSLKSKIVYNLQTKGVTFDGACDILQADISGLGVLGDIKNLRGKFDFNQRSLAADSLKAELLGMPFEIKLGIKDFNTLVLNIDTDLNLSFLPMIAKEKFNSTLINSAGGKAALSIKAYPDKKGAWELEGALKIKEANLKFDKQKNPVENIASSIEFSRQGLNWTDTSFKYQGISYQSSGTLSDFRAPGVNLKLFSEGLSLAADFNLSDRKIKVNQFKGKYLDSQFSISGNIDNSDSANPRVDLGGDINFELSSLAKMLEKQYPAITSMHPAGQVDAQFNLKGNPRNFKNCYLEAKLASSKFSLYGLNAQNLALDFLLDQKIVKIPALSIILYDGLIEGIGALNLDTANLPYQLELKASGIKLEKLKADTASKNKKISGTLLGGLKLSGYANDINKLEGSGRFSILEGDLWEFNLLQGLGKLLFAKDLGSIKFSECTSDFLVKDKFVYTDNLKLKSNVVNFSGPVKIGFNGSLEGALDVEVLSEMVPVSGTFKDITTAIIGQAGKFASIKLSGTLKEPKYSFKPAVTNIIKGLTDVLFGNNFH
ncbi:MAG: AsmA family protein [Candidatus Omnitrophica bacterium]|nr:AsmA family protein [Candidatus Omnitrophota bacterium]